MNTSIFTELFKNISADELIIFGFMGFYIFLIIAILVIALVDYILQSIAIFRMANLAGYDKPWLGFIPYARQYIVINLPYRKFNCCNVYQTYNRGEVFKWYLILKLAPVGLNLAVSAVSLFLSIIPYIGTLFNAILALLLRVVLLALSVATILYTWSIRRDLFEVYKMEKPARITFLILTSTAIYIPFLYSILLLVLSSREPKFGYGKYYDPNRFIYDDEYEDEYGEEDSGWVQISDE